jgi:hypothetical protein
LGSFAIYVHAVIAPFASAPIVIELFELSGHQTGYWLFEFRMHVEIVELPGVQVDVVTPKNVRGTQFCALTAVAEKKSVNANAEARINIVFI